MTSDWLEVGPASITGFGGSQPDSGSGGLMTGVQSAVATRDGTDAPAWSPQSGLFWFAAFALLGAGAIVVSTKVDVGPVRAKAKV